MSGSSSTRIGKRPCSSGMRSEGLLTWKAPAAMKRTWSVRTAPYLVVTVVPSTMGRMSRCTPSRETSGPCPPSRPAILSISSMKMMPEVCTRSTARRAHLLGVDQPRLLLLQQDLARLGDGQPAAPRAPAEEAGQHVLQVDVHLLDALRGEDLERGEGRSRTSTSTCGGRAGRARSCSRSFSRVARKLVGRGLAAPPRLRRAGGRGGGSSRSSSCSSTLRSRLVPHLLLLLAAHHVHRRLRQVAHHGLHVAAHVADLGELARPRPSGRGCRRGGPAGARSRSCPRRWARS